MTYEEIFEASKKEFMKNDVSHLQGHLAVQVDIIGEGEGAFYIELKDGQLHVEPYEYYDHHVKLIASGKDFLKIASGEMNAVMAYTTRKLHVDGDLGKALELQHIIEELRKADKKSKEITKIPT